MWSPGKGRLQCPTAKTMEHQGKFQHPTDPTPMTGIVPAGGNANFAHAGKFCPTDVHVEYATTVVPGIVASDRDAPTKWGKAQRGQVSQLNVAPDPDSRRNSQAEHFAKKTYFFDRMGASDVVRTMGGAPDVLHRGRAPAPPKMAPAVAFSRPLVSLTDSQRAEILHEKQIIRDQYVQKLETQPSTFERFGGPFQSAFSVGKKLIPDPSRAPTQFALQGTVQGFHGLSAQVNAQLSRRPSVVRNTPARLKPFGTDADMQPYVPKSIPRTTPFGTNADVPNFRNFEPSPPRALNAQRVMIPLIQR